MIVLSCETSTLLGSVSIVQDGAVLVEKKSMRQGSHSEHLHTAIEQCLAETKLSLSDIEFFCSGIGPGSFTGIRVSLNAVKTYSYIFNKPCGGLDSLSNIAWQAHLKSPGLGPIVVIINAFKNMVYFSSFVSQQNGLIQQVGPTVVHVKDIGKHLSARHLCLGDGYSAYSKYLQEHFQNLLERNSGFSDDPLSSIIALNQPLVKKSTWLDLLPLYLRSSEAEENLQGIKYTPL